ncbi:hypothetical protein DFH08DRAFT_805943 [Mycena albidolilacea]|uniref:Uncharacterized protein n=1 Tax=Mycena albidolilacea TaxID=1033008 RepID=A0AAD7A846_9AGAR|nr:hypothetical protein DFH08DRAFT_805943 [Mycena albidolilacea]
MEHAHFTDLHTTRLVKLSKVPGFTGNILPGTSISHERHILVARERDMEMWPPSPPPGPDAFGVPLLLPPDEEDVSSDDNEDGTLADAFLNIVRITGDSSLGVEDSSTDSELGEGGGQIDGIDGRWRGPRLAASVQNFDGSNAGVMGEPTPRPPPQSLPTNSHVKRIMKLGGASRRSEVFVPCCVSNHMPRLQLGWLNFPRFDLIPSHLIMEWSKLITGNITSRGVGGEVQCVTSFPSNFETNKTPARMLARSLLSGVIVSYVKNKNVRHA